MSLNTAFLLTTQIDGRAIIPIETVCEDYFSHLTPPKFLRKLGAGDIALPVMRIENSQQCAKGIHLQDLANYLENDEQTL